ncbi:sulfotransferase family 2 domain-containing protein [Roseicyclus mahoneyensis]|uniref:Sulfotransferase family protein n=1 Tax=Roseicyclus mahoneyensis TaxID=164332 RepID=A0A316G3C2_9RHOB|nr:sulfotransferase family 2 domain-containing protein [Roseicyclus mahoneyensis]PWK55123.1 sulfotransferase family protein [Roseicyclus mahoneyensis]
MISHHHQTLFVHIPKCGGQSIEHAFLNAMGLTWKNRAPLLLRPRVEGEIAPPRLAHLLLEEYVNNCYISNALYRNYFKFAVVRNPYDRLVSLYHYLNLFEHKGLNAFVQENLTSILKPTHPSHWFFRPQVDYLQSPAGQSGLDAVYRLESLKQAWLEIAEKAALGAVELPHVNKSHSRVGGAKETLSETSREIIRSAYSADFKKFSDYS